MPWPGSMLITPAGRPAFSSTSTRKCAAKVWVSAGFQTTGLPMMAAEVGRLPAMAVKLNGVMAYTKPSRGRYSIRFHTPGELSGWSAMICCA